MKCTHAYSYLFGCLALVGYIPTLLHCNTRNDLLANMVRIWQNRTWSRLHHNIELRVLSPHQSWTSVYPDDICERISQGYTEGRSKHSIEKKIALVLHLFDAVLASLSFARGVGRPISLVDREVERGLPMMWSIYSWARYK